MIVPTIDAWIEQASSKVGLRVDGGDFRAFEQIAHGAGPGEIFGRLLAPVLAGSDVVRLVWQSAIVFVPQTLLAALSGALTDKTPQAYG